MPGIMWAIVGACLGSFITVVLLSWAFWRDTRAQQIEADKKAIRCAYRIGFDDGLRIGSGEGGGRREC